MFVSFLSNVESLRIIKLSMSTWTHHAVTCSLCKSQSMLLNVDWLLTIFDYFVCVYVGVSALRYLCSGFLIKCVFLGRIPGI